MDQSSLIPSPLGEKALGIMGVFNTVFITDPKKKTLTTLVKMFDVKQACIEQEKALIAENDSYKLDFKETNETKIIAGYNCKKVIMEILHEDLLENMSETEVKKLLLKIENEL